MSAEMTRLGNRNRILFWSGLGASALLALILAVQVFAIARPKPQRIKSLHKEIKGLEERLISAQITSRNLDQVQKLIHRNLAISDQDDLAQGASLNFLMDLHRVLDNLRITVVSLEPKPVQSAGRFVETPYDLEILCDYRRLCELAAKMEKSPRLISITRFEVDNSMEDFVSRGEEASADLGQCRVRMRITTLTWVRKS
ncbi:MAG TPA: type 4a pilus biogenesis protein PilO [Fibrobacteria bacterium]|nr:type 4a pilus biogenesis protein PilO [Fibrobacteria bacterium]